LQTSSFSPAGPVGLDQDHHRLIRHYCTVRHYRHYNTQQFFNLSNHMIEFRNTLPTCKPHPLNRSPARHSIPPSNNPQQYTRQHTPACLSCTLCALKRQLTHSLCACATAADAPQPLLVLAGNCLQQPSYRTVGLKGLSAPSIHKLQTCICTNTHTCAQYPHTANSALSTTHEQLPWVPAHRAPLGFSPQSPPV
jgi:hypothetical protein